MRGALDDRKAGAKWRNGAAAALRGDGRAPKKWLIRSPQSG